MPPRKSASGSIPAYMFDVDSIPPKDRIHTTEGWKLKCCGVSPNRFQLRSWMKSGMVVTGVRVRLPSTRNPKRFTTVAAYKWWREQINALDSLGGA